LTDKTAKDGHWMLGAWIAWKFFGQKGWNFCAGHTPESKWCSCERSTLWYADKYSWVVAPIWWLWHNYKVENFQVTHPWEWKILIAKNLLAEKHFSSHKLYQDNFL